MPDTTTQSAAYALARRHFGHKLTSIMRVKGLTPRLLSGITADLVVAGAITKGVHASSIHQYMKGDTLPTRVQLTALAKALAIPMEDLLPVGFEPPEGRVSRGRSTHAEPAASVRIERMGGLQVCRLRVSI